MKRIITLTWMLVGPLMIAANLAAQPMSGNYDIGGGSNDFTDIISAIAALESQGMNGPVRLNVYTGTYNGQVLIEGGRLNLSPANSLTIKSAPGENPLVINTTGSYGYTGSGFRLYQASYVTIEGMEISNYDYSGIYLHSLNSVCAQCTLRGNYIHTNSGENLTGMKLNRISQCEIYGNEIAGNRYGIDLTYSADSRVFNNMLHSQGLYGVKNYLNSGCEFYFNSVYMDSDSADGYVFSLNRCDSSIVKNNIFHNEGNGQGQYAYYISGDVYAYPLISDFNIIFAPNGSIGYYSSIVGTCANLYIFQQATGLDSGSLSADPMFHSVQQGSVNLHINPESPAFGRGTPVGGIVMDIDGDPRYPAGPCIGCDEVLTDLRVTLTPYFPPPLVIPPGGGLIRFDVEVENMTGGNIDFDAWTEVVYEGRPAIGPLRLTRNRSIQSGMTQTRSLIQVVPGSAPPGYYAYYCHVGRYPDIILHSDDFEFVKSYTENVYTLEQEDWPVWGWDEEEAISNQQSVVGIFDSSPNPFNAETVVGFELRYSSQIKLAVYDIAGREVAVIAKGWFPAGTYYGEFDGAKLASGIYFAVLEAGGKRNMQKLMLLK